MIGAYLACLNGAPELVLRRSARAMKSTPPCQQVLVSPLLYTLGSREPGARASDWPSAEAPLVVRVQRQPVLMSAQLGSNISNVGGPSWEGLIPAISAITRGRALGDGESVVCRLPDCTLLIERGGGRFAERVIADGNASSASQCRQCRIVGHHDFRTEFPIISGGLGKAASDTRAGDPVVRFSLDRPIRPARPRSVARPRWMVPASVVALFLAAAVAAALSMREPGSADPTAASVSITAASPSGPSSMLDPSLPENPQPPQDEVVRIDSHAGAPAIPLLYSIAAVLPVDVAIEQFDVIDDQVELQLTAAPAVVLRDVVAALENGAGIGELAIDTTAGTAAATSCRLTATMTLPPVKQQDEVRAPATEQVDTMSGAEGAHHAAVVEIAQLVARTQQIQYDTSYRAASGGCTDLMVRLVGPSAEVIETLPDLDRVVNQPGRFLRSLSLSSSSVQEQILLQISLLCVATEGGDLPLGRTWSRSQVSAARTQWPAASQDRLGLALGLPQVVRAVSESGVGRHPEPPPFRYLGVIRSGSSDRFAVRLVGEDVVALLGQGETAFGWSLSEATETRLRFTRAGETHEISR